MGVVFGGHLEDIAVMVEIPESPTTMMMMLMMMMTTTMLMMMEALSINFRQ
jgi:hypothetical protein